MKLYKIIKVSIVLLLCMLIFSPLFSQKRITGRVVNKNDEQPVADASIEVKGASIGTKAATDGSFSLNVPRDDSRLPVD